MRNPFLRPATVSQWLRSSLCWTGACLGGLLLGGLVLPNVLPVALGSLVAAGLPTGLLVAHALIWRYAVMGGRAIIRHDEEQRSFSLLRLVANLWLLLLTLFQLACLLAPVIALGLLLLYLLVAPSSPPSAEPIF